MRNAIALLLTAVACSAQQIYWTATLTPENGGTKTRISWQLATFDYIILSGGGTTTHSGAHFNGGASNSSAAFTTLPSPSSFPLTTDIVFTNLNNAQSVTADTLDFRLVNTGGGTNVALIGLVSSNTLTFAGGDKIRVTGSPTGTFVFDVAFSHFSVGTWDGGSLRLNVSGTPVPEPSTYGLALGGLALVGAAVVRRRRSK